MNYKEDPKILNYHDCLLRQSDVDLLYNNSWLNDNLINFYFEYLNHDVIRSPEIFCVGPDVTQLIKLSNLSNVKDLVDSLDFFKRRFILFALNDMEEKLAPGGTHWSLIVIDIQESSIYHLDSIHLNSKCSVRFASKINGLLNKPFSLIPINATPQENSFDCGIHVICNAHHVVDYLHQDHSFSRLRNLPCPINSIRNKRTELIKLIRELSKRYK